MFNYDHEIQVLPAWLVNGLMAIVEYVSTNLKIKIHCYFVSVYIYNAQIPELTTRVQV